jgi:hypothetical protein
MDEIDLVLAGMQREVEEEEREIHAYGERLAAGENGVRRELNAAIRRSEQLRSDMFELKREFQRFTPEERAWQTGCCCGDEPHASPSEDEVPLSRKEVAQLEMRMRPQLCALTDDAVALLALAWDHPTGAIESVADMCGATDAHGRDTEAARPRWSASQWRAAVGLLEDLNLVERPSGRFECFELTWIGYRVAGLIHDGAVPPEP